VAAPAPQPESLYLVAFTDWLACAAAGAGERAARAVAGARASGDDMVADVAFAGTAGHVLDYDDTFSEGVAHVSAACAPAALVVAAHLDRSLADALGAYAEGFEAMAALAAASHPALYDAGWHPTAVCGPVGATVAAGRLLDLSHDQLQNALALAVLRAGGTRGAFGTDGKALQVGLAAAAGVQAALLARSGASVDPRAIHGPVGFEAVLGATWPDTLAGPGPGPGSGPDSGPGPRAIERNWIKLHPSCLGTHSPIEAALIAAGAGYRLGDERLSVAVHPLARQAANRDVAGDGLSAKFSIPYCVAHTLIAGPPGIRDFAALDPAVTEASRLVDVVVDPSLPQWGAALQARGAELARVQSPRGAPERPVSAGELAGKVAELAGDRLTAALDEPDRPAAAALDAAGLAWSRTPAEAGA
jgi:2-methylcitrate dehydratase PrpD